MKSVLQAFWLFTVTLGNIFVVIIAEVKFFQSQAAEFFLFSAIMAVDICIFVFLACRYTYRKELDDTELTRKSIDAAPDTFASAITASIASEKIDESPKCLNGKGGLDNYGYTE